MENKIRIEWIDALKFLGIWAIYIGHFGELGGRIYPFVFSYHVPLFFFASGMINNLSKEKRYSSYIRNKIKGILIPYYLFSIISLIPIVILNNATLIEIRVMVKQCLLGIRNNLYAPSLWFLPCLFIISILYQGLKKLFNKKYLIVMISLFMYIVAEKMLPHRPILEPKWIYNVDSALYYIIYYALGDVMFDWFSKLKLSEETIIKRVLCYVGIILIGIYTLMSYCGIDYIQSYAVGSKLLTLIYPITKAINIILFSIIISMILKEFKLVLNVGRNTLYMCGNEFVVKLLVQQCLGAVGLTLQIDNPLKVVLYSFILLGIVYYIVMPFEIKLLHSIENLVSKQKRMPKDKEYRNQYAELT